MEKRSSTIGDLMERRRILDGAKEYKGHTYLDLARFDENTKHMIIFDVLTHNSPQWEIKAKEPACFWARLGIRKPWHIRKPVPSRLSAMPQLPRAICITTAEIWHDDPHSTACRR